MRIPQRLDYALRALVLLAGRPAGSFEAAGDLADELRLPKRFVEQQITELSRAGVVTCRRGALGGCALSRPAHEITVREIVLALNGEVLDVPRQSDSATAEMWQGAAHQFALYLDTITLADLAERQKALDGREVAMFFI